MIKASRHTTRKFGAKWQVTLLLAAVVLLSLCSSAFANVIKNWDIEVGTVANAQVPQYFTAYDGGGAAVHDRRKRAAWVDPAVANALFAVNTRNYCLQSNSFLPGVPWTGFFQDVYGVYENDTVNFTAWGRSDNLAGGAFAWVKVEFYSRGGALLRQTTSAQITAGVGAYVQVTAVDVAPTGTNRVRFVLECDAQGGGGGDINWDTLGGEITSGGRSPNPDDYPLGVTNFSSNKQQASRGDILTFQATVNNRMPAAVNDVEIVLNIPSGFDLLEQSVRLGGREVAVQEGSVIIPIGTLAAGENSSLFVITM